ncbi:MAG: DUF3854 domain-containing protein [Myxacorys californica WJT36-NPBG1]|nr:DUF3854 domain-containing protein [Myxacorys californica WJT36-NPBG1]
MSEREFEQEKWGQQMNLPAPLKQQQNSRYNTGCNTDHIEITHRDEWVVGSGVDAEIVALNVESFVGETVYELLLGDSMEKRGGHASQYVTAETARDFRKYEPLTKGGWWCSGLDPLKNWEPMTWGQFKGDFPRPSDEKPGEFVKYDAPKRVPLGAHYLRVPLQIWLKVAERYRIAMPTNIPMSERGEAIGFWEWVRVKNVPITLTEGAKKAGCLLTQGYAAIGCSGVGTVVQENDERKVRLLKPLLRPCFQPFATEGRAWLICFDYDKKLKTRRNVNKQIDKIYWHLIQNYRCEPKICRLPGPQKGVDDFVVAQGAEALESVFASARTLEEDRIRHYSGLSFPVAMPLDQRYVSDIDIPDGEKLMFVRSPKNTGKSTLLKKVQAKAQDRDVPVPILVLTHRVQLGQATCHPEKLALPFASEARDMQEGRLFGCGMCVDSMHPNSGMRFDADNWYSDGNVILVLDEVEQFIKHLLFASTEVSRYRTPILKEFQKLLKNILESDHGKIICLDADLCDLSINFIRGMAETSIAPWIVENHWKPEGEQAWTVYEYDQTTPKAWLNSLFENLELGPGFIFTESQKSSSTWSTTNLETILQEQFPEKKILRIDAYTVADPKHAAYRCVADINKIIADYDIVLASPTIGTGVSIDVRGHFKSVWGCFWGVGDSDCARQALSRVREPVDRHVWAKSNGVRKIARGETSLYTLLHNEEVLTEQAVARIRATTESFSTDEGFSHNDTAFNTWGKIAVIHNFDSRCYRANILKGLEREGHAIEWGYECPDDAELYEALTKARDAKTDLEDESIVNAADITDSKAEELSRKKEKSLEDWFKERKHELQKKYLVPINKPLIERDRDKWFSQIRLHYFATVGEPFLVDRDRNIFEGLLQSGQIWKPTLNRSVLILQVACLKYLKVLDLLHPKRAAKGYRNTDRDLIELAQAAIANRKQLNPILNATISDKMTPIKALKLLVGKLGLILSRVRQEGGRGKGNRQWVYSYEAPKDEREKVFAKWIERDALSRSESAVHTNSIYIDSKNDVHGEVAA